MFEDSVTGTNTSWTELMTNEWSLASQTGDYKFNTFVKFSNYPDIVKKDGGVTGQWI